MKRLLISGLSAACVGLGAYLLLAKKDAVAPAVVPEVSPVAASRATPLPPAMLPDVIELTDLDPLLDPPARPLVGVPFDAENPVPVLATPFPMFIPPAVD